MRRKAAGTIHITAHGRTAHSGSAPDRGRNALLALAMAAQAVASRHAPDGPSHLTAVPTILRSGEAFNVVPGSGELYCDVRADDLDAIEDILTHIPAEHEGVRLEAELVRRWPGMRSEEATVPLLASASTLLGRTHRRGGPRRRVRREPLRVHDPADGRRPRPARRQGPQPGRVRPGSLAAQPRRGRAGPHPGGAPAPKGARPLQVRAIASSSCGRSQDQRALRCGGRPGRRRRPS